MEHHVGIDVSLELSNLCVLDPAGKAVPRASRRSVFTAMAESAALTCPVSSWAAAAAAPQASPSGGSAWCAPTRAAPGRAGR